RGGRGRHHPGRRRARQRGGGGVTPARRRAAGAPADAAAHLAVDPRCEEALIIRLDGAQRNPTMLLAKHGEMGTAFHSFAIASRACSTCALLVSKSGKPDFAWGEGGERGSR